MDRVLVPSTAATVATSLPTDILLEIFDHFKEDYHSTFIFQTVCWQWHNAAILVLYKVVVVRNDQAIRAFIRTLQTSSLGSVVAVLRIGGTLKEEGSWSPRRFIRPVLDWSDSTASRPWGWDVVLATLIDKCVNLRDLHLDLLYGTSVERVPAMPANALSHLQKLEIVEPRYTQWTQQDLSQKVSSMSSHWLTDAISTASGKLDFPSLLTLTMRRARRLPATPQWASFPALRTLVLQDLERSAVSLGSLLNSTAATLEDITYSSVMIKDFKDAGSQWPEVLPRIRRVAILETSILRSNPAVLLQSCSRTVKVFEFRLCWKNVFVQKDAMAWPALPAAHTFVISLDPGFGPALGLHVRTLDISGEPADRRVDGPAWVKVLTSVKDVVTCLTIRQFDFMQESITAVLPQMRAVKTLTVDTGHRSLSYRFHAHLPVNIRTFHLLGYLNELQYDALKGMYGSRIVSRYPYLKSVEIHGGKEDYDLFRLETLRRGFQREDVALHVHSWSSYK